jgi:hypothetical protein
MIICPSYQYNQTSQQNQNQTNGVEIGPRKYIGKKKPYIPPKEKKNRS